LPHPKGAVVAVTWLFGRLAVEKAAEVLLSSSTSPTAPPSIDHPSETTLASSIALDAVEAGINVVELDNQGKKSGSLP
jgi:hypothetical protein